MLINLHSYYSLRYGTIAIDQIIDLLKENGHERAVLTDINNTSGALEFIQYCQQKNFEGFTGVEFRNDDHLCYIGIAKNNQGFKQLNDFLTQHNIEKKPFPDSAPSLSEVFFVYPFGIRQPIELQAEEFIGVRPGQLTRLFKYSRKDLERMVMWAPVSFSHISEFRLHCQLRAINHNILLSQLKPFQAGGRDEVLMSAGDLVTSFSAYPQLIHNTHQLLNQCSFRFDFGTLKNKQSYTGTRQDDKALLEKLAMDGWCRRYGPDHYQALARVKKELEIIDQLGFAFYFLITWDIIRYTMHRGFYHVGRGSGANSIIAYCLQITDVCPLELDLYFERFLNPKRKVPPDFDIDYSWKDRDEVFDYIFTRYGKRNTAILGTMSTFKDRSIIREIGKIYGLPKAEIDQLIDYPQARHRNNEVAEKVLSVYETLPKNFPNQRSMHAGGILISEAPMTTYCAMDLPPKGILTTQFDMYLAEEIGFTKLDILSQRGIGHIKEAVEIIAYNQDKKVDIHAIPSILKDPTVMGQLEKGDSIGCFYIESPAMRGVLKKLRCSDYLTLVAASSIIRPGVGSSGMMDTYIRRFHDPTGFTYLHPVLEEQLKETYGVMIYQEDVLKVGHYYGGLGLDDADVLRRLMSGKNRGAQHLVAIQEKFFSNCKAKGYDELVTAEIWRQMASFAGYSFSKAHSASYAVESCQSLFLKAHYPLEFITAVINNEGGFYARWVYVTEARKAGAKVHLPCVNQSMEKARLYGHDLYLGLAMIAKLASASMERILSVRGNAGPYLSLEDFIGRTALGLEQVLLLINSGALRFTGQGKKPLLWSAHLLASGRQKAQRMLNAAPTLITFPSKEIALPFFEIANDETFYDEMAVIGFSVSLSPFSMLQTKFRGTVRASELLSQVGHTVKMVGLYVTYKPTMTKRKEIMAFGTFLDQYGHFFDTVHFPTAFQDYPFSKAGLYLILGKVTESFGFPSITVEKMVKLPIRPDPRFIE